MMITTLTASGTRVSPTHLDDDVSHLDCIRDQGVLIDPSAGAAGDNLHDAGVGEAVDEPE